MRYYATVEHDGTSYKLRTILGSTPLSTTSVTESAPTYEAAVLKTQSTMIHFGYVGEVTTRLRSLKTLKSQMYPERVTDLIVEELRCSGITEYTNSRIILGTLFDLWAFNRSDYYWMASGPGLPLNYVDLLMTKCPGEIEVERPTGDEQPRTPLEVFKGFSVPMFYIYTQRALLELTRTLKQCSEDARI